VILGVLVACGGPPAQGTDSTPPDDTSEPPTTDSTVEDGAWAHVVGAPADALGNAVDAGFDLDGDGDRDDLLAAAYLGNRVCALFGPLPEARTVLDDAGASCVVGETDMDYAGYGSTALDDATGDGFADVAVGSIGNGDAGANAGKVYVVDGPLPVGTSALADVAFATWRGETPGDYAGIAIGAAGDLTGDGTADLLVGASGFDGDGGGGGRAYVIPGPIGPGAFALAEAWTTVTGLGGKAPPPHGAFGTGDFVGDALSGTGDFDGDGVHDLALGASGDGTAGVSAGKAAVFFGPVDAGAFLVTDADVTLLGAVAAAYTGSPLRDVPDLTGDGRDDLLVSADNQDAGVVYVVSPATGQTSVTEASARFEGAETGDQFGYALSDAADVDGDGALDLAIAAPYAADTGAVWFFHGPFDAGRIATDTAVVWRGLAKGDGFGSSVDVARDLDGDGDGDVVVGARNSHDNGGFSGTLTLFDLAP
jgi:hypothetical protein